MRIYRPLFGLVPDFGEPINLVMERRNFISMTGSLVLATTGVYLLSDKNTLFGNPMESSKPQSFLFLPDEREILTLAALAPSGHNTQPWFIKYQQPYHWIICNDKTKWLPAVDPTQRETILSIGAFIENLELAANSKGYSCEFNMLATANQAEEVASVMLTKAVGIPGFDTTKIGSRRTVRSNYLSDLLKKEDISYLIGEDIEFIHWIPNTAKEYQWLKEQTIEANRIQAYRDPAQRELANWIRFSKKEAEQKADGLTMATMEIEGFSGWVLRNFYSASSVMKTSFRDKSIELVIEQVSQSAGWFLITSRNNSVASLIETGRRFQRMLLKVRERGIAIHPMTQILEEPAIKVSAIQSLQLGDFIQFILRTGYIREYPNPVSLRRPVDSLVRSAIS